MTGHSDQAQAPGSAAQRDDENGSEGKSRRPSGYVEKRHRCDLPYVEGTGDIWRCECGRVWRSHHPGNPDYAGWYRLGPILRRLHGVR